MSVVIFSPSQVAFWQEDGEQWVDQISNATEYSSNIMGVKPLPFSEGNDAKYVNPKLYSSEDFDEILDRIIETIFDTDGWAVAATLAEQFDYEDLTYLDDTLWNFRENPCPEPYTQDDLEKQVRSKLRDYSHRELENTYNSISANICYWDGNEYFIHAVRL